jgi:hypothetical protein
LPRFFVGAASLPRLLPCIRSVTSEPLGILLANWAVGFKLVSYAILLVIVQVALIIHVLRTGRDYWWIFLLLFVPGIGALVYFFIEVLPSLRQSMAMQRTMRRVSDVVDPGRDLRRHALEYQRSKNVASATRLAAELVRDGKIDEAIEVCEGMRGGIFEHDPTLLLTLAEAHFAKRNYAVTVDTLDLLRQENPGFRSPDGHLLYAKALEADGRTTRALEEYDTLARYYPGVEARLRLAQLKKDIGETDAAIEELESIVEDARLAPRHFRRTQKEWIDAAKRELDRSVPRTE